MSSNNDDNSVDEIHGQPDIVVTSNNDSTYTSQHPTEEEPDSHLIEGYTPLSFNMNDMIDMNDNDEGEMHGGEFANSGYYHIMGVGASPKRINGIKDHALGYSMGRDHDSDNNEHDSDSSFEIQNQNTTDDATNLDVPVDFLSLAEQALRGLEDDHRATLELSTSHNTEIHDTNAAYIPGANEINTTSNASPLTITNNDQLNEGEEALTTDFTKMFPPLEETTSETVSISTTSNVAINVNAVQKAMNSIRLKSPQLATALDAGALSSFSTSSTALQTSFRSVIDLTSKSIQSMESQSLSSHAVIPNGPLAAFRRSTPKAKSASANLSRSATLSEAVLRLWPLISFRRRMRAIGAGQQKVHNEEKYSKILTIHILGCDHVECSSEEILRKAFGPFARWLSAALQSGVLTVHTPSADTSQSVIDSLLIEVSGPNVPDWILDRKINLLPTSSSGLGGLVAATAIFNQREYHEQKRDNLADMAIAYNAGIWGYDSWKPTLSFMCQSEDYSSYACIPFVVTAYTIEECEDDAEVIAEIAEGKQNEPHRMRSSEHQDMVFAHQIWAPEPNQFSSRVERKTASVPRQYYENGAWQAWLLGPSTVTTSATNHNNP